MEENCQLAIFNIKNLYGNISHSLGLQAVKYWLNNFYSNDNRISSDFILQALELILKNNSFQFNGMFFRQKKGTAMGTKVAPVYATLTLGYLEPSLYRNIENKFGIVAKKFFTTHYYRYLDEVLIIYNNKKITNDDSDNYLNNLNLTQNFFSESFGNGVSFLDF